MINCGPCGGHHSEENGMAQFKLNLELDNHAEIDAREVGSWEDFAREQYGAIRRKMLHNTDIKGTLTLVSPEGEIVLEHNQ